jgi:hypothetical protein
MVQIKEKRRKLSIPWNAEVFFFLSLIVLYRCSKFLINAVIKEHLGLDLDVDWIRILESLYPNPNSVYSGSETPHTRTCSVADPHHFDADPDLACYFDAEPNPETPCHFDADPDPTFYLDADPDLASK